MNFCTHQQILNWVNVTWSKLKFPTFKLADCRHFENRYIAISQRKIIRFRWHFVHSSRFWIGWTSRDQKWKSALDRLRVRQNVFLVWDQISYLRSHVDPVQGLQTRIYGVSKTHNCHGEEAVKLCSIPYWKAIYVFFTSSAQTSATLLTVLCVTTQTAALGMCMLHDMKRIGLHRKLMSTFCFPTTPPWTFTHPVVKFDVQCYSKSCYIRIKSYELDEVFKDYNRIFTDGSSDSNKVSAAAVSNKQTKTVRHWMLLSHNDSVIVSRLWIGHTHSYYSFLFTVR